MFSIFKPGGRGNWLILLILAAASPQVFPSVQTLLVNGGTTERVVVANNPLLNPPAAITIELWVRPNSVAGCQTLVGKGFATAYWLGICSGRIRYYTHGSGTNRDGNQLIPVGQWTHVAVTFDGAERRYYVNGVLDLLEASTGSPGINAQPLGIGGEGGSAFYPGGLFPFDGRLSEVRMWSYARSEQQLRDTMYEQLTQMQPGLISVWPLEGGPEDRFGIFFSTLEPGATWSGIQSPPLPHDPLRIRQTIAISMDGNCNDIGYSSATDVPAWYEDADRLLSESNPMKIHLGADTNYIYVCLDNRKLLNDSIYTVEIDPNNDGGSLLNTDDYRFRFWPGNLGLETARGQQNIIGNITTSSWSGPVTIPAGLAAAEDLSVEFQADFEMRIPRSIFPDPLGVFRIRVLHNFLVNGGLSDRSVIWPVGGMSTDPSSWQVASVDLSAPAVADTQNPWVFLSISNRRPRFFEPTTIQLDAGDDIDVELLEILVDGVVVKSLELPNPADRYVGLSHTSTWPVGRHVYAARAYDHAGRVDDSRYNTFRVDVDGEPPRVSLLINPREPAPGQSVTITAIAIDASGVRSMHIESVLGGHLPTAKFCDLPTGGVTETCVWNLTPGPDLTMVRLVAGAADAEGYSSSTADYVVLWGNDGPDSDDDGLSDFVESGLCTSPVRPDSDFDGLSDGWEVLGIQFADGSELPLPEYGTNPCHKNMLLQLDFETGARPPATGIDNMVNQYRSHGITAYVDLNERVAPTAYDQSHINAKAAVYQQQDGSYYFDPKRMWAFYYGYERNLTGRSGTGNRFFSIDHDAGSSGFCASGPKQGTGCRGDFECGLGNSCVAGCKDGTNKGLACSGATDCPMGDGSFASCTAPCVSKPGATGPLCRSRGDLSYRLFHELGHAVGLGHGGMTGPMTVSSTGGYVSVDFDWDNSNLKPHQVSTMNYYYNTGIMCMRPIPTPIPDGYSPRILSKQTYIEGEMGTLNENLLNESYTSVTASNLRAQDCSFAAPDAFPVFRYSCTDDAGTQFEVLSDGQRTLARHPKGSSWDFDVPAHAAGIDWNCNGVIDPGTVAENVDASGWRSDGYSWDPSLWVKDSNLNAHDEFSTIPKPLGCQILYRPNCQDRAKSCYDWPTAYRNGIQPLATGITPTDCRDEFMATRAGHSVVACRGGSDSEFGTGDCPPVAPDTPNLAALDEKQQGGWDDWATTAAGAIGFDPQQQEGEGATPLPGVELCDMEDNDGDGEIDEDCNDSDADGTPDVIDNCPTFANADQADRDGNHLGDACQFPQLANPQAAWNGANLVTLSWNNDGVPLSGVVVYRYGETATRRVYRGSSYPSSTSSQFVDAVSVGDTYTYVLRPLNLNGVEGTPISVQVIVDIPEGVFADSFETP